MDQSQLISLVRYDIREPSPVRVGDTHITARLSDAINVFHQAIRKSAPSFLEDRKMLVSNTNIFSFPTDAEMIKTVWDYRGTGTTVTDASKTTPIVITANAHGIAEGGICHVQDVTGNTGANGTWQAENVTTNTLELKGSVFVDQDPSGGIIYAERKNMQRITHLNSRKSSMTTRYLWFPRGRQIVIDQDTFRNDIVIDYTKKWNAITDVDEQFHTGLAAYCVISLMALPPQNDPDFPDKKNVLDRNSGILRASLASVTGFKPSSEPQRFPPGIDWSSFSV